MDRVARSEVQIEVEVEFAVGVEAGEGWGRGNMDGVLSVCYRFDNHPLAFLFSVVELRDSHGVARWEEADEG